MAEQQLAGSIAAPGFYGLNTQDSSVQLSSGYALEAFNCVIDKSGRIGARKGWTKVNTNAASTGNFRAIYEVVTNDGNFVLSAANNKIYTGTTTLTEQPICGTSFKTGTYSQSGTTITVTITGHGYANGSTVSLDFTSGTAVDGTYVIASVPDANSFTVTAAASATTSGNVQAVNVLSYTISDDNWQISGVPYDTGATPSGHAVLVQKDQEALIFHKLGSTAHAHTGRYGVQRLGDIATLPDNHSTSSFKPNTVMTAYGRTWVGDISGDRDTVYFSDLLDPTNFKTGTAGYLNIGEVVPNNDAIVALAAYNGFLIIFCTKHILVYANPTDPSALTLQDLIVGTGCIARDSVQSIGTDLLFLSQTGVQSLQRVIQEKSLPFRDVSKNVRDELISYANTEDADNIKAVYYPTDAFYLLSFPGTGFTYCFDTRGSLENGAARTTIWRNISPTAFCLTQDRQLYIGKPGYIGKYEGYTDNTALYRMSYYTNYFDFDQPTTTKMLKRINMVAIGGSAQSIAFKWAFDYISNYRSGVVTLATMTVYEYGTAEYNIAEYSNGIALDNAQINAGGSGKVLQLGFEADINNAPLSIQKIDFSLKAGKTII